VQFGEAADGEGHKWLYRDQAAGSVADHDCVNPGAFLELAADGGELRVVVVTDIWRLGPDPLTVDV
jgi:hypothetical protein